LIQIKRKGPDPRLMDAMRKSIRPAPATHAIAQSQIIVPAPSAVQDFTPYSENGDIAILEWIVGQAGRGKVSVQLN
jgi:hypothetical protein